MADTNKNQADAAAEAPAKVVEARITEAKVEVAAASVL